MKEVVNKMDPECCCLLFIVDSPFLQVGRRVLVSRPRPERPEERGRPPQLKYTSLGINNRQSPLVGNKGWT